MGASCRVLVLLSLYLPIYFVYQCSVEGYVYIYLPEVMHILEARVYLKRLVGTKKVKDTQQLKWLVLYYISPGI